MNQKFIFRCVFLLSLSFLTFSCKKDLKIDPTDNKFPINLYINDSNGVPELSWDKANISSFVSYIIVRSNLPIPLGLEPTAGNPNFEIVKEITNVDTISYSDGGAPWNGNIFYKLYINIGTRFLESPSIKSIQSSFAFNQFFDVIKIDSDSSWAIMLNKQSRRMIVFDFNQNEIIADEDLNVFFNSTDVILETGMESTGKVLYIWNYFTADLIKLSLPDLKILTQVFVSSQCFSLISNNKGLLYSTNYDATNSINIRKQQALNLVKGVQRSNYYETRVIGLLNPITERLVEIASTKLIAFEVNTSNYTITNQTVSNVSSGNLDVPGEIIFSNDYNYFVASRNGTVYDKDLKLVVSNNFDSFSQYAFSEDSKFFYQAGTDLINGVNITKFSFPEMDEIQSIELPIFTVEKFINFHNSLLIFGIDPSTGNLLFKKITF